MSAPPPPPPFLNSKSTTKNSSASQSWRKTQQDKEKRLKSINSVHAELQVQFSLFYTLAAEFSDAVQKDKYPIIERRSEQIIDAATSFVRVATRLALRLQRTTDDTSEIKSDLLRKVDNLFVKFKDVCDPGRMSNMKHPMWRSPLARGNEKCSEYIASMNEWKHWIHAELHK